MPVVKIYLNHTKFFEIANQKKVFLKTFLPLLRQYHLHTMQIYGKLPFKYKFLDQYILYKDVDEEFFIYRNDKLVDDVILSRKNVYKVFLNKLETKYLYNFFKNDIYWKCEFIDFTDELLDPLSLLKKYILHYDKCIIMDFQNVSYILLINPQIKHRHQIRNFMKNIINKIFKINRLIPF